MREYTVEPVPEDGVPFSKVQALICIPGGGEKLRHMSKIQWINALGNNLEHCLARVTHLPRDKAHLVILNPAEEPKMLM
jgi:hypothetical protein